MVVYLVALGAGGSLLPGVALGTEEGTRRDVDMCVCAPPPDPQPAPSVAGGTWGQRGQTGPVRGRSILRMLDVSRGLRGGGGGTVSERG